MLTPHEVEAEVRATVSAFLHTGALPDEGSVEASLWHLADDFTGMGTGPGDYYPDRAAFGALLHREKERGPYPGAYEMLSMHVRELREGLALAEGQIRFGIDVEDQTHVVEPRCSFVLERLGDPEGGRWLITHFHFSIPNAMQREGDSLMDALENRNRELEAEVARRAAEIERALAKLRAAQTRLVHQATMASLGQLTAGIAHEIKNPLNFVNNFAALSQEIVSELEQEIEPTQRQALLADLKANAAKIEEHGCRADAIVRAMMAHARSGGGERRSVELNGLVEEYVAHAYHALRARHPASAVTLDRDLAADAGEVEVAPQEIGRVLINLLDNAFDAVRERAAVGDGAYTAAVRIVTRRTGEGVEVRVEDNGRGMPAEIRARVFEPFFTTKPPGEGTGLGLSLAHDIVVKGHSGSFRVESEEDRGTAIVVSLPA